MMKIFDGRMTHPWRWRRGMWCGALVLSFLLPPPAVASTSTDVVLLAHGMSRTRLSMLPMKWSLERAGYRVLNWGYSSTRHTIPELSAQLDSAVARLEADTSITTIHFVGHSLGGILIRDLLARRAVPKAGRVVMLASPNQGSRMADRLARLLSPLFPPISGLTTDSTSFVNALPPVPPSIEIGVIAGTRDGKVTPQEAFLPEAKAHTVVPGGHFFIMMRREVQELVVCFLREGSFKKVGIVHPR